MTANVGTELISGMLERGATAAAIGPTLGVSPRTAQRELRPVNPRRRLTGDAEVALVTFVHERHHDGASIRTIVANIKEVHGLHRSVGFVHSVIHGWVCPDCS